VFVCACLYVRGDMYVCVCVCVWGVVFVGVRVCVTGAGSAHTFAYVSVK
jgi:hypothetical protein